mmetsp:Transcript_67752/g.201565  ORF Transcript_67752/g.201565 Transcript_67752/m.201565 type:complete len:276 (-) Transcript_67752:9-836(-)
MTHSPVAAPAEFATSAHRTVEPQRLSGPEPSTSFAGRNAAAASGDEGFAPGNTTAIAERPSAFESDCMRGRPALAAPKRPRPSTPLQGETLVLALLPPLMTDAMKAPRGNWTSLGSVSNRKSSTAATPLRLAVPPSRAGSESWKGALLCPAELALNHRSAVRPSSNKSWGRPSPRAKAAFAIYSTCGRNLPSGWMPFRSSGCRLTNCWESSDSRSSSCSASASKEPALSAVQQRRVAARAAVAMRRRLAGGLTAGGRLDTRRAMAPWRDHLRAGA